MKKEKSCGCIVISKNKVLLVKHRKGHWDFPKGHMEEGETEQQTAIREVKEETNVKAKIISEKRYITNYIIQDKQIDKEVIFFLAEPLNLNQKPQLEEVDIAEWQNFNDALKSITYERSRELLKEVIEDLNK